MQQRLFQKPGVKKLNFKQSSAQLKKNNTTMLHQKSLLYSKQRISGQLYFYNFYRLAKIGLAKL